MYRRKSDGQIVNAIKVPAWYDFIDHGYSYLVDGKTLYQDDFFARYEEIEEDSIDDAILNIENKKHESN